MSGRVPPAPSSGPAARSAAVLALHPLAGSAVQLWREHRTYFVSEGTATALRIGTQLLLLTADHVLEQNGDHDYYVADASGQLVRLTCTDTARCSTEDIAVLRLSLGMQTALSWVRAATYGTVRLSKPAPGLRATFIGYPAGRNRALVHKRMLRCRVYAYSNLTLSPSAYSAYGYDLEKHVLARFERKKTVDVATGGKVTSPKPHGMSGGPLWIQKPNCPARLIGVNLEVDLRRGVIVGGLVSRWIAAVCAQWADLRALIR